MKQNTTEIIRSLEEFDFFDTVDLHIHSTCSDGKMSPEEILKQAETKGLKYISICDHNTLDAYSKSEILNNKMIISGIEFDCWYKGILIHILGYGFDVNNEELLSLCAKNKSGTESDLVRFFSYRHPKKVINAIKNAGGIAILAHPACYWAISLDDFISKLINMGLDGIEVYYPYKRHRGIIKFHLASAVKRIAQKYGIIQTGGSDSHGTIL